MVTDSATVTMESLWETTVALSNGAIADLLRPLLLRNGGGSYAYERCRLSSNYFDPLYVNLRVSGFFSEHSAFAYIANCHYSASAEKQYLRLRDYIV